MDESEQVDQPPAPPGWYPHPGAPGAVGYWDGRGWGPPMPPPQQPPVDASEGLIAAGFITAFLIPIVGFVIGIVCINRNRAGLGIAMVTISVLVGLYWFGQLTEPTVGGY